MHLLCATHTRAPLNFFSAQTRTVACAPTEAVAVQDFCGDPGPAWPGNMCAACYNRSLYSSEETLLDRSKGSNGSNSHPKAGLSWPMAYPYLTCSASFCGCTWMCEYLDSKGIQGRKVMRTPPKVIHLSIVHALRSSWLGVRHNTRRARARPRRRCLRSTRRLSSEGGCTGVPRP